MFFSCRDKEEDFQWKMSFSFFLLGLKVKGENAQNIRMCFITPPFFRLSKIITHTYTPTHRDQQSLKHLVKGDAAVAAAAASNSSPVWLDLVAASSIIPVTINRRTQDNCNPRLISNRSSYVTCSTK